MGGCEGLKDYAVTRLEAEPAKNPSFWTKTSEIERSYKKVACSGYR